MVIDELKEIQHRFGYLPEAELHRLSERTKIPVSEIFGVASFYPHFHLEPRPELEIQYCSDLSCHLRGSQELRSKLENWVDGHSDHKIKLEAISCLGRCDRAPALAVNEKIYAGQQVGEILPLLSGALQGSPLPEPAASPPAATTYGSDPYKDGQPRYQALRRLLEGGNEEAALEALKSTGLRGLGGAGFPTGTKWDIVRQTEGDTKYVVCNADESEVGTIKDREILKEPHLLVEGMAVGGLITGSTKGIIYLRHEYPEQQASLEAEIRTARQAKLLGKGLLGTKTDFELEVFMSPGGYICGEETALLEALEGKRAQPRNKPPFPVTHGLWNKPTLLNNVETFAHVPGILVNGPDWYKSVGIAGQSGLKFVGVSGHVNRPGVFEVPMGTPLRELIEVHAGGVSGGRALKAFAPSGASSGFLPASEVDVGLSFETLQKVGSTMGSGAVIVLAEGTCMLDSALNLARFLRNESCGKCVPCRVGSQKYVDLVYGMTRGELGKKIWKSSIH